MTRTMPFKTFILSKCNKICHNLGRSIKGSHFVKSFQTCSICPDVKTFEHEQQKQKQEYQIKLALHTNSPERKIAQKKLE